MRLRAVPNAQKIISIDEYYFIGNFLQLAGQWRLKFANFFKIYLDIGCGKGDFIIAQAQKYPDILFIGIEKSTSVLVNLFRKLDQLPNKLSNLKIINGCGFNIRQWFNIGEVDRIYLNFPDPWPKNKHHKRRLTTIDCLANLFLALGVKKKLFLKTDHYDFFQYSLNNLQKFINCKLTILDQSPNLILGATTEYENRFLKLKQKIYSVEVQKTK